MRVLLLILFLFSIVKASEFVEGEVLVEIEEPKKSISPQSVMKTLKLSPDIKVRNIFKTTKKQIFLIKSDNKTTDELIKKLRKLPYIKKIEPNYIIKPLETVPNDYAYGSSGEYRMYWGWERIKAFQAWDLTTGSNDIVIAVLDTGVDYNHPDLKDNIWKNTAECNGIPGVDDDNDGYIDDCTGYDMHDQDNDPMDNDGHGTHVAGIIGAVGNNEIGIAGVNWHIKILPCKIFDDEGGGNNVLSAAIECLNYLITLKKKGVNIVASNNSWAGSAGYYLGDMLKDAIQETVNEGILFITAAGNEGTNNDEECKSLTNKYCRHIYPCDYNLDNDGIICVTATDEEDNLPWFSNYGKNSVDVAAPGNSIYSTYLRIEGTSALSIETGYKYESGTSMAAPFVTGTIGLLKSMYPYLNWRDIKSTIVLNTDFLPSLEEKTVSEGIINLNKILNNPVSYIDNDMGLLIEDGQIIGFEKENSSFIIDNDWYAFYKKPITFSIYLTDNDLPYTTLSLKLLKPPPHIKPVLCSIDGKTCKTAPEDIYIQEDNQNTKSFHFILLDNSENDFDNEQGKIKVSIGFIAPASANDVDIEEKGGSGGGCSLSKGNDISLFGIIAFLMFIYLRKRKKEAYKECL